MDTTKPQPTEPSAQDLLLQKLERERASFHLHDRVLVAADEAARELAWLREQLATRMDSVDELTTRILRACMTMDIKPVQHEAEAIRFTVAGDEFWLYGCQQGRPFECIVELGRKFGEPQMVRYSYEFGELQRLLPEGWQAPFLQALVQHFLLATNRTLPAEHVARINETYFEITRFWNC